MSDAPKEEVKKKKGGKLPILLALVLALGGGGFFVLKGKSGGAPKKAPAMELAEKETDLEEFLTNMADGSTYIRAKIAVKLAKKFNDKEYEPKFTANIGEVRDAVNTVLRCTTPADIRTKAGLKKLRHDLAEAMNYALEGPVVPASDAKETKAEALRRKGKDQPKEEKDKDKDKDSSGGDKEDWDSQTGPVLQVFLSSIATQ